MVEAYIGLGSNLSEPVAQVRNAMATLNDVPDVKLVSTSSLYASRPQGPQDQPDFVNAVAKIETRLSASALLSVLQKIEREQGKVKKRHWGERVIDLDILLYGDATIDTSDLKIPHPEMIHRDFVLLPLSELVSELPLLGHVGDLVEALDETYVYPLLEHD